jgi:hypothetical protein
VHGPDHSEQTLAEASGRVWRPSGGVWVANNVSSAVRRRYLYPSRRNGDEWRMLIR